LVKIKLAQGALGPHELGQELGNRLDDNAASGIGRVHEGTEVADVPGEQMGCPATLGRLEDRAVLLT
jgi:hypothetical protein